jgi:septal ring factor EnvC (AmiA/AmiB activator)
VGNTGGKDKTALYFEVRHKGKPTNPANWCEG